MAIMEIEKPVNEKQKRKLTALFFACVMLIGTLSLVVMNSKYDSLSRYPYTDQNSRKLIKEYLDEDEIEYIIEYSIAPNMFIAYIQEDGFNIYHSAEYKELSAAEWQSSPSQIVKMVEETRDYMSTKTLEEYLLSYTYEEIELYLREGDTYSPDSSFTMYASDPAVYLNDYITVGTYVPDRLIPLNDTVPAVSAEPVLIQDTIQEPLTNLCTAAENEVGILQSCAGLAVSEGYISYDEQTEAFEKAKTEYGSDAIKYSFYPGHSEHQLGLAVDFKIDGILNESFNKTIQAKWLKENAWRFGFVETYTAEDEEKTGKAEKTWHYRYVGTETASSLHEKNMSFTEWSLSSEK